MKIHLTVKELNEAGLNPELANSLLESIQNLIKNANSPEQAWQILAKKLLSSGSSASYPFKIHRLLFSALFPAWNDFPETAPAWIPTAQEIAQANISHFISNLKMKNSGTSNANMANSGIGNSDIPSPDIKNIKDVKTFHAWTVNHFQDYWRAVTAQLNIVFDKQPNKQLDKQLDKENAVSSTQVCDLSNGVEAIQWFPGAKLNIAKSCFTADPMALAIIYEDTNKNLIHLTYQKLNELSNQIANSLIKQGFIVGDKIGIAMPMNHYAVAIYLGIIKMGGVVVSIADSFSSEEIAVRTKISQAKAIFTQDFTSWGTKKLPLYEKVKNSDAENSSSIKIIVLPLEENVSLSLRKNDCTWKDFLLENKHFDAVSCDPMTACNILFSSGTTGNPKAIVWNHTTAIKAASDAYFHQNIVTGDVLAWPTNLGWMMGPWLIFAALINQASIALYGGAPKDRAFGEFVQRTKVTMLGVVPTIVALWRQSQCMEKLDWNTIKVFSSTGECSNPEDMLYLMSLADYKPVIEYCGGTEIGGAYISSTVVENNYPSLFTTATMGLDIQIIDDDGKPASLGEVSIIPPSIGLSTTLLNGNHHQTYYADMPSLLDGKILRRHGDQIKQYPNGHFSILGRVDDTMNLGGIKTSAAEIERALVGLPQIIEVAAIAVPPPDNGPSLLVIYAATANPSNLDKNNLMREMQIKINAHLNPLFKISDLIFVGELPKTASNKIMRRILRNQYMEKL
jgi:acetyl-CoA synthetase